MEKTLAGCGLICSECDAYIATQNNNTEKLQEIADYWSKEAGRELSIENMKCDGCSSETGRLSGYCSICKIRKCTAEKNISNCTVCADYACKDLLDFLKMAPKAKENLEAVRKKSPEL